MTLLRAVVGGSCSILLGLSACSSDDPVNVDASVTEDASQGDAAIQASDAAVPSDAIVTVADASGDASAVSTAPVLVTVFMHSEDPAHPDTPDFRGTPSWNSYVAFRSVLLEFSERLHDLGVPWDFQPDWNFTLAVIQYEVENTPPSGHTTGELDALRAETGGKNLYRYMSEDLGVQIDPHSHEGSDFSGNDYNYADVAYLINETGVVPSGIVGGHIMSGDNYQEWPRFKTELGGLEYTSARWTATALMGGGTSSHAAEVHGSGIWMPTEPGESATYDNYWLNDSASSLPAIGNWSAEGDALTALLAKIDAGDLPEGEVYTATQAIDHSGLAIAAYGALDSNDRVSSATPTDAGAIEDIVDELIAPLVALRDEGKIEIVNFNDALARWNDRFGGRSNLCKSELAAPTDCIAVP